MRTRTYTVQEWIRKNRLQLPLTPLRPDAWRPPENEAALVFVNRLPNVREFNVTCRHGTFRDGTFADPFDTWRDAKAEFAARHSECAIRWLRLEFWPAAAGAVAARRVSSTDDAASQAALADVRAQGRRVAEFVAENVSDCCIPGLSETSPIDDPAAVVLAMVHQPPCPSLRRKET